MSTISRPVRNSAPRPRQIPDQHFVATGNVPQKGGLRRGKSLLGREEDQHESGLALFKRGATLHRRKKASSPSPAVATSTQSRGCLDNIGPGPKDGWFIYFYLLTCLVPGFLLRACGE